MNDLLGGHIDIAFLPASVAKTQIDSGSLKLLASTYNVPYKNITILTNKYQSWIDYFGYCIVLPKESDSDTITYWRNLVVEYSNDAESKKNIQSELGVILPTGGKYLKDRVLQIKEKL